MLGITVSTLLTSADLLHQGQEIADAPVVGALGGAIALAVVVSAESIQELDDILESLPV